MWKCICGRENADIGNFCVACGAAKSDVISAQLGEDAEWYYYKGGERSGPVAASEISDLLHTRKIDRKTLVWKAGMPDWSALNQTVLGTLAADVVPPIPMQAVSDKYAWALATVSFVCDFFLLYIHVTGISALLILLTINSVFFILDIQELKRTGNDPGNWIWLGLVLIPVYLFLRASKVNQKYGYAITNITLLILSFFVAVVSAI